jgi:hypothetical protein
MQLGHGRQTVSPLFADSSPETCVMTELRYDELIALLDRHNVAYRLLDHGSEGRTEIVSAMRGHPVDQAAKCMVIMVKIGKKATRDALVVVPGGAKVDLARHLLLRKSPRNWPARSWVRFSPLCSMSGSS